MLWLRTYSLTVRLKMELLCRQAGRRRTVGRYQTNSASGGQLNASGTAKRRSIVWESDAAVLIPQTDYRTEGWIRCPKGEGQLELELRNSRGEVLHQLATPLVRRAGDWQYTALEWNSAQATSVHVAFRFQGLAELDHVALVPVANVS